MLLLLSLHLLHSVEFLPFSLVELREDVVDSVGKGWNDDMIQSVNSPVGRLDDPIENDESSLKGGKFDYGLISEEESLFEFCELLSTFCKAEKFVRIFAWSIEIIMNRLSQFIS